MHLIRLLLILLFLLGPLFTCDCTAQSHASACEDVHNEKQDDNCSVFCTDGCCFNQFTVEADFELVPSNLPSVFISSAKTDHITGFYHPFWQPPKRS